MATPIDVIALKCRKNFRWNPALFTGQKKQNFGFLSNRRYSADRARSLPIMHPTFGSQNSKLHPNRFTFGGVI